MTKTLSSNSGGNPDNANEKLSDQPAQVVKPVSWWRRHLDPLEFDLLYLSTIFKLALFPA
jgi:hypothetical protein